MNRIVLIGNGFDLAHGLKTSYGDFILDYLKRMLKKAEEGEPFENELIEFSFNESVVLENGAQFSDRFESIEDLLDCDLIDWNNENENLRHNPTAKKCPVNVKYNSAFFRKLIRDAKWSAIESAYFDQLIYMNKKFSNELGMRKIAIEKLNKEFEKIKIELIQYIRVVDRESGNSISNIKIRKDGVLSNCLSQPDLMYCKRFFRSELIEKETDTKLDSILFVDFNYTSTLGKYVSLLGNNVHYIQIHGTHDNSESVIFGYGDDSHKEYQDLEDANDDELLQNIKPFYYPSKPFYLDLINFIEDKPFDVHVIGHSLGLSDRVLLKTIFENYNCKAIRLFHRGDEKSHFKRRIALSRHFSDKEIMRSKIVNFNQLDVV